MTGTFTRTSSFTKTHARYLASKIAADLKQMQLFYGKPSDTRISAYVLEVVILLFGGYLDSVSYGFKRGEKVVVGVKYDAQYGGITQDDRAGRVRPGINTQGAIWYSFLTHNSKFDRLTKEEKERLELPISRTGGIEPGGAWASDKRYSTNDVGLQRYTSS